MQPPHDITRPTTDRVRESLFSMTVSRIASFEKIRVLDAFAGSGAIGLEALSRGASHIVFAEKNPETRRILAQNINILKCPDLVTIINDVFLLARTEIPFELVFLDPPYGAGLEQEIIPMLIERGYIGKSTLIVIETHKDSIPLEVPLLECMESRIYGKCALSFFELIGTPQHQD